MIIDVPFVYTVSAIPPRKINPRNFALSDTHPVEIAESSADDAVLVARRPASDDDRRPEVEYRHFDGRLWRTTLWRDHSERTDRRMGLPEIDKVVSRLGSTSVPWGVEKVEVLVARKLVLSEKDERIAEIEAAAREWMVVDGIFMEPCSEPVYKATTEEEIWRSDPFLSIGHEEVDEGQFAARSLWRADEYDRMISELGEGREVTGIEPFEVLRPDLLVWDRERTAYLEALKSDVKSYEGELSGAPKAVLMLWADLRDALAAMDPNDEEAVRATIPLAVDLHEKAMEARLYDFQTPFESLARAVADWRRADEWHDELDPVGIVL